MKREDGILDRVPRKDGIEMRYHILTVNGRRVVRRVPWHFDKFEGRGWYSGVMGPEMDLQPLVDSLEDSAKEQL